MCERSIMSPKPLCIGQFVNTRLYIISTFLRLLATAPAAMLTFSHTFKALWPLNLINTIFVITKRRLTTRDNLIGTHINLVYRNLLHRDLMYESGLFG